MASTGRIDLRRAIGPPLALLLFAGVGLAVYYSAKEKKQSDLVAAKVAARIFVKVLTGSEKEKFLTDPELKRVLEDEGIAISIQKAGSREIAMRTDLNSFDVAYPAGAHAAMRIAQLTKAKHSFTSFYTPMAVASWKSLIPVLQRSGLVSEKDGAYFIDTAKLVSLMEKGTRWKDLPGNTVYPVGKSLLVSSTDVRTSNSGAMYLALAAYVANGSNVVDNDADADKVASGMIGLFTKQGFQEASSTGPFEDYISMGIGKAPLAMIYEQQFLEYVLARPNPNPDMVLLYPTPTIFSKHTLVAITDKGTRFAQVMTTNQKINSIAQRYGFRGQDNAELFAAADAKKLPIPHTIVDVVDPPRYDVLENLIKRIDTALSK